MFCTQCRLNLHDSARFCSGCGSPTQTSAPTSPAGQGYSFPSPVAFQAVYSPPLPSSTALISPSGVPQPAFERLAASLFYALDQNVQPQRTNGLEVSKMMAYRTFGGATIPPYYGEQVLPTYASIIPIELIPNQPREAPVLSWNGWHQFLLQKISVEPEAAFRHIQLACSALGIPIVFNRMDFPMVAFSDAVAKETLFRTRIYGMAQSAMTMGALGGGMGDAGPSNSSSGTGKLAASVGLKILGASFGGGGFFPTS